MCWQVDFAIKRLLLYLQHQRNTRFPQLLLESRSQCNLVLFLWLGGMMMSMRTVAIANFIVVSLVASSVHRAVAWSPLSLRLAYHHPTTDKTISGEWGAVVQPLSSQCRSSKGRPSPPSYHGSLGRRAVASAEASEGNGNGDISKLENVLSNLTSGFPFYVLAAAVLGSRMPSTLNWVNEGNLISLMLSSVMMGTGVSSTD